MKMDTDKSDCTFFFFFATPLTVAHQAPLSMGFSRQEYWSGLPFPTPGKTVPLKKKFSKDSQGECVPKNQNQLAPLPHFQLPLIQTWIY